MFNRLLALPERERRSFALIAAGVVTVLIVSSWLLGFVQPASTHTGEASVRDLRQRSTASALSPLATIGESFTDVTERVRDELGGILWGIGDGETKEPHNSHF